MRLFDTHCHIDVAAFDADRRQVLEQARAAGVEDLLVPAIQRSGWSALTALCTNDPHLHPALGMHPMFMHEHRDSDLEALASASANKDCVAIGEIGLDFQTPDTDRKAQLRLLEAQLEIAEARCLPVILHVRKAHEEVLKTLRRFQLQGGCCHAFNGSLRQAGRYIEMGFRLGFGGMLTYPHSTRLRRLAKELPLDAIVLETDAPDMAGAAHQYQRNSPAYLPEAFSSLSALRSESPQEVALATRRNACETLGLPDD